MFDDQSRSGLRFNSQKVRDEVGVPLLGETRKGRGGPLFRSGRMVGNQGGPRRLCGPFVELVRVRRGVMCKIKRGDVMLAGEGHGYEWGRKVVDGMALESAFHPQANKRRWENRRFQLKETKRYDW